MTMPECNLIMLSDMGTEISSPDSPLFRAITERGKLLKSPRISPLHEQYYVKIAHLEDSLDYCRLEGEATCRENLSESGNDAAGNGIIRTKLILVL